MNIKRIYDLGPGKYLDRYTVVTDVIDSTKPRKYVCLCLSEEMDYGFSTCMLGNHLGKQIQLSDLSERTQKHIKARLS